MAERYYESPRGFYITPGVWCEIEGSRLRHAHKRDLRNYFGKYGLDRETGQFDDIDIPTGLIEDLAVRRSLVKLVIGTEEVNIKAGQSPIDNFPDIAMGDEDGELDLYEEVLKTIVDQNRFLARQWPFALVFGQYMGLIEQDKTEAEQKQNEKDEEARSKENTSDNPLKQENEATPIVGRVSGSEMTGG